MVPKGVVPNERGQGGRNRNTYLTSNWSKAVINFFTSEVHLANALASRSHLHFLISWLSFSSSSSPSVHSTQKGSSPLMLQTKKSSLNTKQNKHHSLQTNPSHFAKCRVKPILSKNSWRFTFSLTHDPASSFCALLFPLYESFVSFTRFFIPAVSDLTFRKCTVVRPCSSVQLIRLATNQTKSSQIKWTSVMERQENAEYSLKTLRSRVQKQQTMMIWVTLRRALKVEISIIVVPLWLCQSLPFSHSPWSAPVLLQLPILFPLFFFTSLKNQDLMRYAFPVNVWIWWNPLNHLQAIHENTNAPHVRPATHRGKIQQLWSWKKHQ